MFYLRKAGEKCLIAALQAAGQEELDLDHGRINPTLA